MNSKFLVGGLLGAITSFLLGYLIYGNLLTSMLAENSMAGFTREMSDFQWPFLILSNLGSGFFLSYVFSKWAGPMSFGTGLGAGAVLGLLVSVIYDFAFYATSNMMTMKGYMLDMGATIVITGLIGGVVGWWMGRK